MANQPNTCCPHQPNGERSEAKIYKTVIEAFYMAKNAFKPTFALRNPASVSAQALMTTQLLAVNRDRERQKLVAP